MNPARGIKKQKNIGDPLKGMLCQTRRQDHYVKLDIRNPWNTFGTLEELISIMLGVGKPGNACYPCFGDFDMNGITTQVLLNYCSLNLSSLYIHLPDDLEMCLGAKRIGDRFYFQAFDEACSLGRDKITPSDKAVGGPKALLISLYAVKANRDPIRLQPFASFRDFPGSMPYQGALRAHSEQVLVPLVLSINETQETIKKEFIGRKGSSNLGADFLFILHPFPKIAICHIFYLPDEEFPASVICLFSANALSFMPLDGLADVAEYT